MLFWYQSLGVAVGCGLLWAFGTIYAPDWGEKARKYHYVAEMYSDGLHKSVKKYHKSKHVSKQLYTKDMQDKFEVYEEMVRMKYEENNEKIEDIDLIAAATPKQAIEDNWLVRKLWRRDKWVEVSKEIDEMPYEQRKQLEQGAIGDALAVNYNSWPFKGMKRYQPQFFSMNKDQVRGQSDTAKFVNQMSKDKVSESPFNQKEETKMKDLRILS